jgi:predicted Co/Zn/Cd cation transporter (cation efflux family)
MGGPDRAREARLLGRSIVVATVVGVAGIGCGLAVGSQLIVLDGAYAFIGVAISWLLLLASRLVGRGPTTVYPYGREALTPLVVGLQGFVLLGTLAYASVDAVAAVLAGGRAVDAGWALAYAVATTALSAVLWRQLAAMADRSDLVAAEAAAWRVSTVLGAGMIAGFSTILVLDRTGAAAVSPYVDPVLVVLLSAALLASPLAMVRSTYVELLEGAPAAAVQQPVLDAVRATEAEFTLDPVAVRMTKIGPKLYVEVGGTADPALSIDREDEIRRSLGRRLDALPHEVWLNFELVPDPAPEP